MVFEYRMARPSFHQVDIQSNEDTQSYQVIFIIFIRIEKEATEKEEVKCGYKEDWKLRRGNFAKIRENKCKGNIVMHKTAAKDFNLMFNCGYNDFKQFNFQVILSFYVYWWIKF